MCYSAQASKQASKNKDAASRGECVRQDAAQPSATPNLSSPLIPPAPQREERRSQRLSAEDIRALAETVAHLDFGTEAVAGKERERGSLTGCIKKKRPPRKRAKGAQSQKQRQDAARAPGGAREA